MTSYTEEVIQQEIDDISALCANINDEDDVSWLDQLELNDSKNQSANNQSLDVSASVLDELDENTRGNWLFPVSGFEKRDYQFNISRSTFFNNTLVILPTGLGKTFIASVTIYNFMRWFPYSKIVFMAPTRPLVNQQMSACYDVVGIPKEETAEMTGKTTNKTKRKEQWDTKRIFFATPQVIQSDIRQGIFPSTAIKLLVFDEAHKAKGEYAYCKVIQEIYKVNKRFRVLGLTATAGKTADVIQIIRNLMISKIEHRSESSIDVSRYTHKKKIEIVAVKLGGDIKLIYDNFMKFVDPVIRELIQSGCVRAGLISKGSLIMQRKKLLDDSSVPYHLKTTNLSNFSIAIGLYHSLEILQRHSIHLFLKSLRDDENKTNYKFFVAKDYHLAKYVAELEAKYDPVSPLQININPLPNGQIPDYAEKDYDFGHPKFDILKTKLSEYFQNNGSKAIIFCEYRDTTQLIYILLLQLRPLVMPNVLIGQGGSISQKQQLKIMKEFREGKSNTLICTSVAEEGLDIGEVDLVVCFDINTKNAVRFVQRIGRTGRKRNGEIIVLAAEGKELTITRDLVFSKNQMNKSLSRNNNDISNNLYKAPPLFPKDFDPQCIEMKFVIPDVVEEVSTKATKKPKKPKAKKATKASKKLLEPKNSKESITNYLKPTQKKSTTNIIQEQQNLDLDDEIIEDPLEQQQNNNEEIIEPPQIDQVDENLNYMGIVDKYKEEMDKLMEENNVKEGSYIKIYVQEHVKKHINSMTSFIDTLNAQTEDKYKNFELDLDAKLDLSLIMPEEEAPNNKLFSSPLKPFNKNIAQKSAPPMKKFNSPHPITSSPNRIENSPFLPFPKVNSAVPDSPLASIFNNIRNSSTPIRKQFSPIVSTSRLAQKFQQNSHATDEPINDSLMSQLIADANKSLENAAKSNQIKNNNIEELQNNKFDFLGIMSIEDIFEGCDSKVDYSTSKFIQSSVQDEVVECSVEPKSSVFEQLNINDINDIFGSSNEDKSIREMEMNIIQQDNLSNCSDKTEIYDVEEEIAKIEESHRTANGFERSFEELEILSKIQQSKTIEMPEKENDEQSFLIKTDSRPNLAKLLSNIQNNTTFLSRAVLQEKNLKSSQAPTQISLIQSSDSPTQVLQTQYETPIKNATIRSNDSTPELQNKFDLKSPSPTTSRSVKRRVLVPRRRRPQNAFLHTQAGVDDEASSDEQEDMDTSLNGFVCNESVHDQTAMYAKYVKSIQSPIARGFMLRELPTANFSDIYSQFPQEEDEDSEADSLEDFICEDVDESVMSEVDELEIAEKILNEKRRKRRMNRDEGKVKKKRKVVVAHSSDDEDNELEKLRMEVLANPD